MKVSHNRITSETRQHHPTPHSRLHCASAARAQARTNQRAVELGVVIGRPARSVSAADAHKHIAGYVCAIDVTARNWQTAAKQAGQPWSLAKGCDTFLPMSGVQPPDCVQLTQDGRSDVHLFLDVNGQRRQSGHTSHMIWSIPELIERISQFVTLEQWDVILTGTPSGVGAIRHGDHIHAGIEGVVDMHFHAEELV